MAVGKKLEDKPEEKAQVKPDEKAQEKPEAKGKSRILIKQTDIPSVTLEEAIKVPKAIWDDCGGKPTPPFQVADAVGISQTSTNWRYLSGASSAYSLTNGASGSRYIELTEIGKKVAAPTAEDEDKVALLSAVMTPSILNKFYKFYDGSKLPKESIVKNKLQEMGVNKEKVDEVYELIIKNGYFTGIIRNTKGGEYIYLGSQKVISNIKNGQDSNTEADSDDNTETENDYKVPEELLEKMNIKKEAPRAELTTLPAIPTKPKVFISHGKNRTMVDQLKELLTFGQFEPIVSVDRESTAIPVPDKVFSDMSQCQAGIIHIAGEQTFLDHEGKEHRKINENVLIEIGAAIAFYGKKVILLCQKDVSLPSNLQGLYRCEYEGEQLDYAATMKLLKTFNEFKIS